MMRKQSRNHCERSEKGKESEKKKNKSNTTNVSFLDVFVYV